MHEGDFTRRTLFAAGALGGLAAAGLADGAAAETAPGAAEAANLKLVESFCHSWAAADFDPDKAMPLYFAPDCKVRPIDSQPFINGSAAVAAAFKALAPNGERFKVDILSTYARGPIVVTQRIDTQVGGEKSGQAFPMVGVFLVKNGKIVEWTDYLAA